MIPTPQLPLRHLKPLALRLAFLDAFPADPVPDSEVPHLPDALTSVILSIDGRLANHPKTLLYNDTLEDAVKHVAAETRAEFDEHVRRFPRGLGDPLDRFRARIDGLSCGNCAHAARERSGLDARICCGDDDAVDAIAVEYAGHCIRQIKKACATAMDIASRYYGRFAPDTAYDVRIATQWLNEGDTVENFPRDIHAWGSADLEGTASVVALNLKPKQFDRKTYQSLLYILLHECICHAYQGSVDVTGRRAVIGNADVFGEGWMDFVTHLIFTQVLAHSGPFGAQWADALPEDPDCELRGSEIHLYRTDSERAGASAHLHRGTTAARNLQTAFNNTLPRRAADDAFLELSLKINGLPLTGPAREQLVTNVRAIFGSRRREDVEAAKQVLRDYLRGGMTKLFVDRCMGWFPSPARPANYWRPEVRPNR